jgi:hypothetical protein
MPELRASLDALYPGLFNALVGLSMVGLIWVWRKVSPSTFEKLPPKMQALPAVVGAGLMSSFAAQQDLLMNAAVGGVLGGIFGVGSHRALKESKLSYGNRPAIPAAPSVESKSPNSDRPTPTDGLPRRPA